MILPQDWMMTMGQGAKVMILDSGFINAQDYLVVTEARNFSKNKMNWDARHGDVIAHLIGSRDPLCLGIAPRCELYIAKVWDGECMADWSGYEKALDWAIFENVDVVNMSFAAFDISAKMKEQLEMLDGWGTILVAAHAGPRWPAVCPHVVPVGPMRHDLPPGVLRVSRPFQNGEWGHLEPITAASYATAIVSGVAACAKSFNPGITRPSFVDRATDNPAVTTVQLPYD